MQRTAWTRKDAQFLADARLHCLIVAWDASNPRQHFSLCILRWQGSAKQSESGPANPGLRVFTCEFQGTFFNDPFQLTKFCFAYSPKVEVPASPERQADQCDQCPHSNLGCPTGSRRAWATKQSLQATPLTI